MKKLQIHDISLDNLVNVDYENFKQVSFKYHIKN
jgi:hypothetical protein